MTYKSGPNGFRASLALVVILIASSANGAIVYQEDFAGQDGKGAVGPGPTVDVAGVSWTVDVSAAGLTAATDYFQVLNEQFVGRDLDGPATWTSPVIDISGLTNVSFSLDAVEDGDHESQDFFDVFFRIDGGPSTLTADFNGLGSATHTLIDDWTSQTIAHSGLSGSTLQLSVGMQNNADSENIILDNVRIEGTPASPRQVREPSSMLVWSLTIMTGCLAGLTVVRFRRRGRTFGGLP